MPYFTLHKSRELAALVDRLKVATYTPVASLAAYAQKHSPYFAARLEKAGLVPQDLATEGGDLISEVDDGFLETVGADVERLFNAADFLGAVAGEGADGDAGAGAETEVRVQADEVEEERAVVAGVDQGDEVFRTEPNRDKGGTLGVGELDRGAGN